MLFPVQSITDPISKTSDKHIALVKANLLMDLYFDDEKLQLGVLYHGETKSFVNE